MPSDHTLPAPFAPQPPPMRITSKLKVPARVNDAALLERRRSELIERATQLFSERGFHRTTVRELASALDWQMGTLYLYIENKEDLLYLVADAVHDAYWEGCSSGQPLENASESLLAGIRNTIETVNRLQDSIRIVTRETLHLRKEHRQALKDRQHTFLEFWSGVIDWGIKTGEFRPVPCDLVAFEMWVLSAGWLNRDQALSPHFSLTEYTREVSELLMSRVRTLD